jgi:hypothetical protein
VQADDRTTLRTRPGQGLSTSRPTHFAHTAWGRISPTSRMAVVESAMAATGDTSTSRKMGRLVLHAALMMT